MRDKLEVPKSSEVFGSVEDLGVGDLGAGCDAGVFGLLTCGGNGGGGIRYESTRDFRDFPVSPDCSDSLLESAHSAQKLKLANTPSLPHKIHNRTTFPVVRTIAQLEQYSYVLDMSSFPHNLHAGGGLTTKLRLEEVFDGPMLQDCSCFAEVARSASQASLVKDVPQCLYGSAILRN